MGVLPNEANKQTNNPCDFVENMVSRDFVENMIAVFQRTLAAQDKVIAKSDLVIEKYKTENAAQENVIAKYTAENATMKELIEAYKAENATMKRLISSLENKEKA